MSATLTLLREDGTVICEQCDVADRAPRRVRGLLGRKELGANEGMLLRPAWSIHTAFLRFPIDVLFVNGEQVVMKKVAHLKPWRTTTCRGAREVVELAAGVCDRLGIEPGQRLSWAPRHLNSGSIVDAPTEAGATNQEDSQLTALIASPDERFRSLATFLIGRNGFKVCSVAALDDVLERLAKTRFDLVVLDCAESFSAAARVVAALEVMHPTVRPVLVSDPPVTGWHNGLNVLDKWTSIERLPSMILGDETDAQVGNGTAPKRW
jgi:uncharacterized membrane protein (UPF0127 family)/CheY-like chemotaxis protein